MAAPAYSEDTQYIHKVINASAITGMMDDARWEYIIAVIMQMMEIAEAKAKRARRNPSFDGAIQGTHFEGQVTFGENLLRTFTRMYDTAGKVLTEARDKLPYVPAPQDKTKGVSGPERDTHTEEHHGRREDAR